MDTFELLPSLAQGELSEASAPELVAAIYRSRASGTLWLETPETAEIRIFFRAGDMCGTGSFAAFKTLAHVLLERDLVGALEIEESQVEAQAQGKRHGEVLLQRGSLTPERLREALVLQHRANLGTLLQVSQGRYDWRGWEPPPPWTREVSIDPVSVIVDALEDDRHAVRREKILDWLGASGVRLSPDWPELEQRITLDPLDRRATGMLAIPRTVAHFVRTSQLSPMRAEALLAALLLAGGLEPKPVAGEDRAPEPAAHLEPDEDELTVVEPEEELEEELEPLADEPEARPASRPRNAKVDEAEAIARLDSLSIDAPPSRGDRMPVDLDPDLPPEEAPLELDLDHGSSAPEPAPAPSRDASDARARELRKKMFARGMRNLGVLPSAEARGTVLGGEEEEPAGMSAPLDPAALGDDDRKLLDEVRRKVRAIDDQNAYERLGVSASASQDTIKHAYLEAAKRYHPDHAASGPLAALLPELQKLFTALKEAWETLSSPTARLQYDQQLKTSGGRQPAPAGRHEEAALSVRMGEVLLKKRDFKGAVAKLRRAVELETSGETLAALAWAIASDPQKAASGAEEAASLIQRALKAQGVTARTWYVAGVLWRTKDPDGAVEAFRKALELDKSHSDAALELRLMEQRRAKQPPPKEGGGLSGLFGKRKPSS